MSLESTLKYCQLPPDAEEKTESEFRDLLDSCRSMDCSKIPLVVSVTISMPLA